MRNFRKRSLFVCIPFIIVFGMGVLFLRWFSTDYGVIPVHDIPLYNSQSVTIPTSEYRELIAASGGPSYPRQKFLLCFSGDEVTLSPTDLLALILYEEGSFNTVAYKSYMQNGPIKIEYVADRHYFTISGMKK